MKIFFKKRISTFLILILVLSALQFILVSISLNQTREPALTHSEIRTILLVILVLQSFLVIVLISYLPGYLKKMLDGVNGIINDISRGNYQQNIDLEEYKKSYDKELVEVVESLKKMLTVILKFDSMKKEKIQEQKSRILAVLNLTGNGIMIVNKKGDVVFVNDPVKEHFPTMNEDINILETSFGLEIDNNIKKYVREIVKTQSKFPQKQYFMASMKRHIALRNELVRDINGNFIGAVIAINNLVKKETEKPKEQDEKKQ